MSRWSAGEIPGGLENFCRLLGKNFWGAGISPSTTLTRRRPYTLLTRVKGNAVPSLNPLNAFRSFTSRTTAGAGLAGGAALLQPSSSSFRRLLRLARVLSARPGALALTLFYPAIDTRSHSGYTVAVAPWATTSSRLSILRQRSAPLSDLTPTPCFTTGRRSAHALHYAAFRFRYCPFLPLRRYFSLLVNMRHSTVTSQRIIANRATLAFFLRRNFS